MATFGIRITTWFLFWCGYTPFHGAVKTTSSRNIRQQSDSWHFVTSGPVPSVNPECLHLDPFQHLYNIKGLDVCEPHHFSWHYLQQLTSMNWQCRQNIIDVLADRFKAGSSTSQYCSCKIHNWSDNGLQNSGTLNSVRRILTGIQPECFAYKGCLELKELYENDTCAIHAVVWESLKSCPSDISVEGQVVTCQSDIVQQMYERFNGSVDQYDKDMCYCYPSYVLASEPADCRNYGGFSRLQLNAMIPRNCITHFSVWKYLASQPVRCQNWIISFMLDKTTNNFECDCHETANPVFGRSLRKRDTSLLPSCQSDSLGWNVLHSTFLSDPCHSHWYVWRHLADTHGHCRQYLINEMFATFAVSTSNCQCQTRAVIPPSTTVTIPTTTTVPPHMCVQCNDSNCATTGSSIICETGKDYCMTSIIDYDESDELKRRIERKCASREFCKVNDKTHDFYCLQMDQGSLGFAMTCSFCCVGSNCNKPPALIPPVASFLPQNAP